MPTVTNFGDLVVTGNVFVSGTGTSTFVSGITSSGIITSTGFTGAAFTGGTFQGTTITASTGFTGGTFSGSTVGATSVTATNFTGTNFSGSTFTGSSFNFPSGGNITIAGSTATSGYYLQTNGTQVQWAAAASTSTAFTGSTVFVTGQVSIGSSFSATYPLSVNGTSGSIAAPYSNLAYNSGGWYQAYEPTVATTLQIYTPGRIGCSEVDVLSDRRIKTQIQDTEDCIDLIRKLRVRNFRYIDPVEHGTKTYKGLIAQEVREVIPEAVGLHEGAIPDIFQVATDIQDSSCVLNPGEFTIKIGDVIKVMDGETSKNLTVLDLSEGRVNFDSKLESQKVFVYGHLVDDFHTVSYDRLVPILIRSVQQLIDQQYRPMTPTSSDGHTS